MIVSLNRCPSRTLTRLHTPGCLSRGSDGRFVCRRHRLPIADAQGNASSEDQRDAEAEGVADVCARLIGKAPILDRKTGEQRLCRPGDIALLAPTGSELWRYEEALENRGIAVASQAGKGLFQRQEIQDLIALTRVLADRRDTLAFGALLRGPLVGLTEEELLDIVWSLPPAPDSPDITLLPERNALVASIWAFPPQASLIRMHATSSRSCRRSRARPMPPPPTRFFARPLMSCACGRSSAALQGPNRARACQPRSLFEFQPCIRNTRATRLR